MTEWMRVKDKTTGHEQTINAALFNERAYEKLDKPAVDINDLPLPGKPHVDLPKATPPDAEESSATDDSPPPAEETAPTTRSRTRAGRA